MPTKHHGPIEMFHLIIQAQSIHKQQSIVDRQEAFNINTIFFSFFVYFLSDSYMKST